MKPLIHSTRCARGQNRAFTSVEGHAPDYQHFRRLFEPIPSVALTFVRYRPSATAALIAIRWLNAGSRVRRTGRR